MNITKRDTRTLSAVTAAVCIAAMSLFVAPTADAAVIYEPCTTAGAQDAMIFPDGTSMELLCWYGAGNKLMWVIWPAGVPLPSLELAGALAKENKIGQPCEGTSERLECRNGIWRSRRTAEPVRTRDRCLIGRWFAPIGRTGVLLQKLIPIPGGNRNLLLEGDILMSFENTGYWGYSSANMLFQSPPSTGVEGPTNHRYSMFVDGSFGTRSGRIMSSSMTSQTTYERVWSERTSYEPLQTFTTPIPNGAMPYRCTRSTLRVTVRPGITLLLDRQP